jgi:hypothetical protein
VAGAARAQRFEYLAIRRVPRSIAAIHRFRAAGWRPGVSLHGLDFGY